MEKIKFVDANLHQISDDAPQSIRYAIDLGVRSTFAKRNLPREDCHFFVSANPWKRHINMRDTYAFLSEMRTLNPDVAFGLLELEQIDMLNYWGKTGDFCITDCWTCSTLDDWHGRIDGYYSLTDRKAVVDWGENETDVYVVFGFVPGQEKTIILPTA